MRRDLIVRVTLAIRAGLLLVAAVAVLLDHVWVAVVACALAVAAGTPAYPAQVAAMPGIAGDQRRRATDLLVTIEVAAFVVGAAVGGLLLHPATRGLLPWVPVAMTLVALLMICRVSMPAPVRVPGRAAEVGVRRTARGPRGQARDRRDGGGQLRDRPGGRGPAADRGAGLVLGRGGLRPGHRCARLLRLRSPGAAPSRSLA